MFKLSRARSLGAAVLIGVLAASPLAAQAQVYKCMQANGTPGYQSIPCPSSAKPAPRPTAAQLNSQQAAAPKDDKPYDDPYKNSVGNLAQAPSPGTGTGTGDAPARQQAQSATSNLVADVQARNRHDTQQQAFQEAHKNDKPAVNMAACNSARRNLGVFNEQRPVFSYDNKGNRVFVEDKDRAGNIADAQRNIASYCP